MTVFYGAMREEPHEVICVKIDEWPENVVVHRDLIANVTIAFHSPLEDGPVHCDLCESGVPVAISVLGE
jgi:hypothetical protein